MVIGYWDTTETVCTLQISGKSTNFIKALDEKIIVGRDVIGSLELASRESGMEMCRACG